MMTEFFTQFARALHGARATVLACEPDRQRDALLNDIQDVFVDWEQFLRGLAALVEQREETGAPFSAPELEATIKPALAPVQAVLRRADIFLAKRPIS